MKKIVVLLGLLASGIQADNLFDSLSKGVFPGGDQQKIFGAHLSAVEEKKEKLEQQDQAVNEWREKEKKNKNYIIGRIAEVKAGIEQVKTKIAESPDNEFLTKKLSLLNEQYQVLRDTQELYPRVVTILQEDISLLKEYLSDSSLESYRKKLNLIDRKSYSFEEFQEINRLILEKKSAIDQLKQQEKNSEDELKSRKQMLSDAEQARKQQDEQDESVGDGARELIALRQQLATEQRELNTLRLSEIEYKRSVISVKLFIQNLQLNFLEKFLTFVKPAVKITQDDIAISREELAKKKAAAAVKLELYRKDVEQLGTREAFKDSTVQTAAEQYGVERDIDLEEWSRKPLETVKGYASLLDLLNKNEQLQWLKNSKGLFNAQITLEDEKIRNEALYADVLESESKIINKTLTESDTVQELKKYNAVKVGVQANKASFKELQASVQGVLQRKKKALERSEALRSQLQEKKTTLFKNNQKEYDLGMELLQGAQTALQKQIDILGKTDNVYTDVFGSLAKQEGHLRFIIDELESPTTILQRPEGAITMKGVRNIIPDLSIFMNDVRAYIFKVRLISALSAVKQLFYSPMRLLSILFFVFIFCLIMILIRRLLSYISELLKGIPYQSGSLRFFSYLLVCGIDFFDAYFVGILFWLGMYSFLLWYSFADPYIYIIFYLLSIGYFSYYAYHLLSFFSDFNVRYDNVLLDQDFQKRFLRLFSLSLYSSIIILFFRNAYTLGSYFQSEVPDILFLILLIIIQFSLIFLITKDQIFSLIPDRDGIWRWLRTQVDQYYYIILMVASALIIMMNPYVGLGKIVIYVLSRIISSAILIYIFFWFNIFIRRGLSHLFFATEQEVAKERFSYGKSLYGFFVIASFLTFIFVGCIVGAKIWGWPQALVSIGKWSDLIEWLQTPILLRETAKISTFSILQILFFISIGFVVAFIVNRLVLQKIFDILLIDLGVQNTVLSLVRYAIVIIAIILGFQSVNLDSLVLGFLGALLLSIGWVIKEPAGDFIAYFIILVQRPLKIGDYIKINEEVTGVVRKITPRSIILRRKNSTTIILPNTQAITNSVVNWNYLRGFIAFNDIFITVGYQEDPTFIKKLFLEVMEENFHVLKTPKPIVRLHDFSEAGFQFMARGFISSNYTLDQWDVASDIRFAMIQRLRENGISIAVPTRLIVPSSNGKETKAFGMTEGPSNGMHGE